MRVRVPPPMRTRSAALRRELPPSWAPTVPVIASAMRTAMKVTGTRQPEGRQQNRQERQDCPNGEGQA